MRCGDCGKRNWSLINGLKKNQSIKEVKREVIGMITYQEARKDILVLITALEPLPHVQVIENMGVIKMIKAAVTEIIRMIKALMSILHARVNMNMNMVWKV